MAADIAEQPAGYARLLEGEAAAAIADVAAKVAEHRPKHVVFVGRGTSDHAALYGAYLTEIRLGIPVGLASPSAITLYGARRAMLIFIGGTLLASVAGALVLRASVAATMDVDRWIYRGLAVLAAATVLGMSLVRAARIARRNRRGYDLPD